MDPTQNRYWPFDVLPLERQSGQQQREIRFLEAAYQAGCKPYMFGSQNFGAAANGRAGEILDRGCRGKHWEVLLVSAQELIVSVHVDDFEAAAESLLRWLRGDEGAEIVDNVRGHLFSTGVTPSGFVLHSQKA